MFFYPPVLRPPCERGLAPPNMGPPAKPKALLGRGRARKRSEECPRLGVPSEAYFVRTTARGSLGTFHPWKVPRPGAKHPPSFVKSRDRGTGKRQTSSGAPSRRALHSRAATWGGPYQIEPKRQGPREAQCGKRGAPDLTGTSGSGRRTERPQVHARAERIWGTA